jgi:HEAT repeat protein
VTTELFLDLKSGDWERQVKAAQALTHLEGVDVLDALAAGLYASNLAVTDAAATALLRRGDERALEPLLRAFNANEPDDDLAEQVQDVLSRIHAGWFNSACIRAVTEHGDPFIRMSAAEALGHPLYENQRTKR